MKKLFLMIAVLAAIATGAQAQSNFTVQVQSQDKTPVPIPLATGTLGTAQQSVTDVSGLAHFSGNACDYAGTSLTVTYAGITYAQGDGKFHGCGSQQVNTLPLVLAQTWEADLTLVDHAGKPVSGATLFMGSGKGTTDANGTVSIIIKATDKASVISGSVPQPGGVVLIPYFEPANALANGGFGQVYSVTQSASQPTSVVLMPYFEPANAAVQTPKVAITLVLRQ